MPVKEYLDNIRHWEIELPKMQTGQMEHIAISYLSNYKGMNCEINLEIPDSFYKAYSGCACYKAVKNLVFQKQLKAYPSIEYGLIEYGMKLVPKKQKQEFFNKYAIPYNERIKREKEANASE